MRQRERKKKIQTTQKRQAKENQNVVANIPQKQKRKEEKKPVKVK